MNKMFRMSKGTIVTMVAGIAVGSGIVWNNTRPLKIEGSPFNHPISRYVNFNSNKIPDIDLRLFQYQTCPFCCKLRAYLDFKGIDYKIIEVNSVSRKQLKWSEYRKVPILLATKNEKTVQLNDSSVIVSILESYLKEEHKKSLEELKDFYPSFMTEDHQGKSKLDFHNKYQIMHGQLVENVDNRKREIKWRKWVDNVFIHTLAPNIYRTPSEALGAFNYFSEVGGWRDHFGSVERLVVVYVGAVAMFFVGKMIRRRYRLESDVRLSLFSEAAHWSKAVSKKTKNGGEFLGGAEPGLADLSMYGVLNSIEGCVAFTELMDQDKRLNRWFYQVRASLKQPQPQRREVAAA